MPRRKIAKTVGLAADIYNLDGEVVGKASLPAEIFAVKVTPQLVAQAIRVYQANERLGTHSSKTRSEVAGSTRKIYRQKGTGRARHGAITAPIFIGGGAAHGPKPRDYSLTLSQKMKTKALFAVLTDKLQSGKVKIIRGLEKIETKTKKMDKALVNLKLSENKRKNADILLITPASFENVRLAGRNLSYLTIEDAKLLNSFKVISHKDVVFMEEAVPVLAGHFLKQVVKTEKKIKTGEKTIKRTKKMSSK